MKLLPFTLLLAFFAPAVFAQDNYDADLIPAHLKNRANAIVRNSVVTVDMRAADNVSYTVSKAITVLNKNGENSARLVLFYDKNTSIKSIKGEVYNEVGKPSAKFSQSDFSDESAINDFSLFEDSRVKHYLPSVNTYPYTIVYNYEIRYRQNLIIPDWVPQTSNDVAVEKSSYILISKAGDAFRVKSQNISTPPEEQLVKDQKTTIWKVSSLLASKPEPYSPFRETYQAMVKVAPQNFSYYNVKGDYSNWQELGKWQYDNLLKGRNTLPEPTVQMIRDLVKSETSDKEKAKKIYQYLQNKTRYISVQIGIGGFQPTKAADVDRLGYGDCKALVNYMQSLLNVVGIESYYCVVEAGKEKKSLDPSYASMNQGNHVILCMPLQGDTTWLECTSQKIPFGYLGDFTDDRYVLACTPAGGKLLHTPKLGASQNLQVRKAQLVLSKDGNITGHVKTVFSGAQYDNHEALVDKPLTEQQKLLKEAYDIDNINFNQISYRQQKDVEPEATEDIEISIRNYATLNNDKLFLKPNVFNIKSNVSESRNRTFPLYINRGYTDIDTISFELPENVIPLIAPDEKEIRSEFGSYSSTTKMEGNKLIYFRKFVLNEGTFAPALYAEFTKFIANVNTSDHLKLYLNFKK